MDWLKPSVQLSLPILCPSRYISRSSTTRNRWTGSLDMRCDCSGHPRHTYHSKLSRINLAEFVLAPCFVGYKRGDISHWTWGRNQNRGGVRYSAESKLITAKTGPDRSWFSLILGTLDVATYGAVEGAVAAGIDVDGISGEPKAHSRRKFNGHKSTAKPTGY